MVLKATKDQMISRQVWRIPLERISINRLRERPEEAMGVYANDNCSISAGMGKYIPVKKNREITGEVLIEISDKTTLDWCCLRLFITSRRNWAISLWSIITLNLCC